MFLRGKFEENINIRFACLNIVKLYIFQYFSKSDAVLKSASDFSLMFDRDDIYSNHVYI